MLKVKMLQRRHALRRGTARHRGYTLATGLSALLGVIGCSDLGTPPERSGSDGSGLFIDELVPDRTVIGDTVRVLGSRFGSSAAGRAVHFPASGGGSVAAGVVSWSPEEVRVIVPAGAESGGVEVIEADAKSNAVGFTVAARVVSYAGDVAPIFAGRGCTGCHGGDGGLSLGTRAALLRGDSDHGPVVISRRSAASVLTQKLRGTAGFGARMPVGGAQLPESEIRTIADWIDQGVRDN
jgi:hypothetical protein